MVAEKNSPDWNYLNDIQRFNHDISEFLNWRSESQESVLSVTIIYTFNDALELRLPFKLSL